MSVVLVTGSKGQLGQALFSLHAKFPEHQFHFVSREELNISDASAVKLKFVILQPDFCINCAAYTAVDKAELEQDLAYSINATGVKNIIQSAAHTGCRVIHISTDYVFNGSGTTPYKEDHEIDPINVYGATKAAGEAFCFALNDTAIVIRTSWVYAEHGNNFVKTMLRLMQSRESINVVADQWGCPTYAPDLAEAILTIISKSDFSGGIYHYSNSGAITWFQFAKKIAEYTQSVCTVQPITTDKYPTPAKRPSYSVMDVTKISSSGIVIHPWEASLKKCLHNLQNHS